jgi:hypothetical protein
MEQGTPYQIFSECEGSYEFRVGFSSDLIRVLRVSVATQIKRGFIGKLCNVQILGCSPTKRWNQKQYRTPFSKSAGSNSWITETIWM